MPRRSRKRKRIRKKSRPKRTQTFSIPSHAVVSHSSTPQSSSGGDDVAWTIPAAPSLPPPPPDSIQSEQVADALSVGSGDPFDGVRRAFALFSDSAPSEFARSGDGSDSNSDDSDSDSDTDTDTDTDSDDEDYPKSSRTKLSRRARKARIHERLAALKRLVRDPARCDEHDVNSPEPFLLNEWKGLRYTIPVPDHWKKPKRFLQHQKGRHRTPFELPDFIQETGIEEVRGKILARQRKMTAKQRMRARMNPKLGRSDISYDVLYNAFFRRGKRRVQPKGGYGTVYDPSLENLETVSHFRPGKLSKDLKAALGMPTATGGGETSTIPPPWLLNMQRAGPPPAYSWLRIPGVNAPIPPGAKWGFHPGGWGQAPRDESGRMVFGAMSFATEDEDAVDRSQDPFWGEFTAIDEEDEEEEEEPPPEEEEESDVSSSEEEEEDEAAEEARRRLHRTRVEDAVAPRLRKSVSDSSRLPPPPSHQAGEVLLSEPIASKIEAPGAASTDPAPTDSSFYKVVPQIEREVAKGSVVGMDYQYAVRDGPPPASSKEVPAPAPAETLDPTKRKRPRGRWDVAHEPPKKKRKKYRF